MRSFSLRFSTSDFSFHFLSTPNDWITECLSVRDPNYGAIEWAAARREWRDSTRKCFTHRCSNIIDILRFIFSLSIVFSSPYERSALFFIRFNLYICSQSRLISRDSGRAGATLHAIDFDLRAFFFASNNLFSSRSRQMIERKREKESKIEMIQKPHQRKREWKMSFHWLVKSIQFSSSAKKDDDRQMHIALLALHSELGGGEKTRPKIDYPTRRKSACRE